jgi:uncharacterized protein (TIGR00297 family)
LERRVTLESWWLPEAWASRLLVAAGLNLILGATAWYRGAVSRSGFLGGSLLGAWILFFGGEAAYLVLLWFFVLGTLATRMGYREKLRRGVAQESGGRRGARHALANCATGTVLITLQAWHPHAALGAAYVAAFGTALADTLGSEIGQLWGRRTIDPLRLRPVSSGTEGAVSLEGTLAGWAGAAGLAGLGAGVGLVPWPWWWVPLLGAALGSWLESLMGSAGEPWSRLDNEVLNFLNTITGAGIAAAVILLFS